MKCPECGSRLVYRSRSADAPYLRLLLCTRMRRHWCGEKFLVPVWQTLGQDVEPPPQGRELPKSA